MEDNKFERVVAISTLSFVSTCLITWILFLSFKLIGILPESFPWFWVWFPFWLPFATFGAFLVIGVVCCLFATGLNEEDRL